MLLRLAAISLLATACTDPVVEMQLHMPSNADTFDSSCVSGVTVVVAGTNIASDDNDYTASCQEISAQDRLTGIHDTIRGKFTLELPPTGMSGIEIFGWSGPTPCNPGELTPDLIFHSSAAYIGQDTIDLKLTTTMDCAKQAVKVRPVELMTLVSGATPSSASCADATVADGQGYAALGQIMGRPFDTGVDFYGGVRGADVTAGIASFSASMTGIPARSCLAYDTGSERGWATSCATPGAKVCAAADEVEAPFLDRDVANEATALDEALLSKWKSMVFVSVWTNQNPRKPVAGATIEIAAADGQVVYIDPPVTGSALTKRGDSATGASGLALVYTDELTTIKVNAGGASRDVVIAAPTYSPGAALVVMP